MAERRNQDSVEGFIDRRRIRQIEVNDEFIRLAKRTSRWRSTRSAFPKMSDKEFCIANFNSLQNDIDEMDD